MARRRHLWTLALVAPLLIFLLVNFLGPIALMLSRSVRDVEVATAWPRTAVALRGWSGPNLPDEGIVAGFVEELGRSYAQRTLSAAANRLNYDIAGFRTLLFRTARVLPQTSGADPIARLAGIDARWGRLQTWSAIGHATGPRTSFYLLAALDRRLGPQQDLQTVPAERAVFIDVFGRTFVISATVTLLCVLLGYPIAHLLANLPERHANLLLILVLLPFWTSVLVRTTAWMVLLQNHGIVNDLLMRLDLLSRPLQLIYNRIGVYVAMTHVLLPYFVLPLYGVMKGIPRSTLRAAQSLGATPLRAWWKVYVPQSFPGVAAGALIVFILALGYYVTPALVGGGDDQMISYFIAFYTNQSLNWGMAAALSLLLLVAVLLLALLYSRTPAMREVTLR